MNIQTKFNHGDKCFYLDKTYLTIRKCSIEQIILSSNIEIKYNLQELMSYEEFKSIPEDSLYETLESAIDTLKFWIDYKYKKSEE